MHSELMTISGQKILFVDAPGSSSSTVQIWFRAGSVLEEPSEWGIAHFLEHMFFKGTPTRPGAAIAQEVESFGGEINAFTSFDYTCYYINCPDSHTHQSLKILLDMVSRPLFSESDIPAERGVVFEEYRRALDNPSQFHFMELQKSIFKNGYDHPILGSEQTINQFSRAQLLNFRQHYYNQTNSLLVVAGKTQTEKKAFIETIKEFQLPTGQASVFPAFATPTSSAVHVHTKAIKQATLNLILKSPSYTSPDAAKEDLAINCLAHGETSRLYHKLVTETSLCNGLAGSTMYFVEGGAHFLKFQFPLENLAKILAVLTNELTLAIENPLTSQEIQKIKNQYLSSKIYEKESIESFAFSLGHSFAQTGDIKAEDDFIQRIDRCTTKDVNLGLKAIMEKVIHANLQIPEGQSITQSQKELQKFVHQFDSLKEKKKKQNSKSLPKLIEQDQAVSEQEVAPGVKLVYRHNTLNPTFVMHAYIKGGLTTETAKNCGSHTMLSRLITNGYEGCSYEELKQDLEVRSASLNGFAGKNAYGLTMHGQTKDFDSLIKHFSGTLMKPTFLDKYFKHELKIQLRMIDNQLEDPVKQAYLRWNRIVFNKHPYALENGGTKESLKKLKAVELKKRHLTQLQKNEMIITYCGDLDLEVVMEKLTPYFNNLRPRPWKKTVAKKVSPLKKQTIHHTMKREQVQLIIGKPAFSFEHKNDVFLKMLTAHLSGQGSELFTEVRDRQGLCYAVHPIHMTAIEAGAWGIYIGTGKDKWEKAHMAIMTILNKLQKNGFTADEFERTKKMLLGQQKLSLQTNDDYAQFYSIGCLHGLGLDFQHKILQQIQDAKHEDFQKFCKTFLVDDWSIVTVGDIKNMKVKKSKN
jgi:zinc protease